MAKVLACPSPAQPLDRQLSLAWFAARCFLIVSSVCYENLANCQIKFMLKAKEIREMTAAPTPTPPPPPRHANRGNSMGKFN